MRMQASNDKGMSVKAIHERDKCYEKVRSMLITDCEVDSDKLLCLHLLTAHVVEADDYQLFSKWNLPASRQGFFY